MPTTDEEIDHALAVIPAAIAQLETLGRQLDVPVYSEGEGPPPPDIAARAVEHAIRQACDVVIIDTSGRLQIDSALMAEIAEIVSMGHYV